MEPEMSLSLEDKVQELTEVINDLETQLFQQRFNNLHNLSIDQKVSDEMLLLRTNNKKMFTALEKIEDPRKMDHTERDIQTQIYCLQNVAHTTLEEVRGNGRPEGTTKQ